MKRSRRRCRFCAADIGRHLPGCPRAKQCYRCGEPAAPGEMCTVCATRVRVDEERLERLRDAT